MRSETDPSIFDLPDDAHEHLSGQFAGQFEVHALWLRRLARALVADDHIAEDLSQDAWLAAIERPARRRSMRAWLATVLRNRVRDTHRRNDAAARAHAEVAQGTEDDDNADRMRVLREVLDALDALDVADRDLLLARYLDGRRAVDLAPHYGVPASTIRSRIQRTLERVRTRLDVEEGGRHGWCAILMPMAGLTAKTAAAAVTTASATVTAATTTSTAGATGLATTGLGVTPWLAVFGVAIVVGVGFVVNELRRDDGVDVLSDGVDIVTKDLRANRNSPESRPRRRRDTAPAEVDGEVPVDPTNSAGATSSKPWTLTVRVRLPGGLDQTRPVRVRIDGLSAVGNIRRGATARYGDSADLLDGVASFDLRSIANKTDGGIEEIRVFVKHPDCITTSCVVPTPELVPARENYSFHHSVDVDLHRATVAEGIVRDHFGEVVAKAAVGVFSVDENGHPHGLADVVTRTDKDGRYRLRFDGSTPVFLVASGVGRDPVGRLVARHDRSPETWDFELESMSVVDGQINCIGVDYLRVEVVAGSTEGRALRMATEGKRNHPRHHRLRYRAGRLGFEEVVARTDAAGRFAIAGLLPGSSTLRVDVWYAATRARIAADRHAILARRDIVVPTRGLHVTLPQSELGLEIAGVDDRSSLRLRVIDDDGTKRFGFVTRAVPQEHRVIVPADRDVRIEVTGAAFHDYEARLRTPASGEVLLHVVNLVRRADGGGLTIRPSGPAGSWTDSFGFELREAESRRIVARSDRVVASERGFDVDAPSGEYELTLRAQDWRGGIESWMAATGDVMVDGVAKTVVSPRFRRGGALVVSCPQLRNVAGVRATIIDANDTSCEVTFREAGHLGRTSATDLFSGGVNRVHPALAPGRYRLELQAGAKTTRARFEIVEGVATHVTLAVDAAGRLDGVKSRVLSFRASAR